MRICQLDRESWVGKRIKHVTEDFDKIYGVHGEFSGFR